jgi:hypothetical protein
MLENISLYLINKKFQTNNDLHLFDTRINNEINKNSEEYQAIKTSVFFDSEWYKKSFLNNSEEIDPVTHYIVLGWKLKLPPSIKFSSMLYIDEMKKNGITTANPLLHYESSKNDIEEKIKIKSFQYEIILNSNLFDREWYKKHYLKNNSDNTDELEHYIQNSEKSYVKPNEDFNTKIWYQLYPKLLEQHINPLFYYICNRKKIVKNKEIIYQYKIIKDSNLFDTEWYEKEFLDGNILKVDALLHYLQNSKSLNIAPNQNFSSKCYYEQYNDVFNSKFDALFHYIMYGKEEHRITRTYNYQIIKQSKYFNANKYIENNNLNAKTDAVEHYLNNFSSVEFVSSNFDSKTYLESYTDVRDANIPPLLHYLRYGCKEGRSSGVFRANCEEYIYESDKTLNINHKRALVLAGFLQDGIIEDYKLYLIEQLSQIVDSIYFICDSPINIHESNFDKIIKYIRFAQFKRHGKYDFGSYKIGFRKIKEDKYYNQYEQILFANDSILGPVGNLNKFIDYVNKSPADAIGLVANHYGYKDNNSASWSAFSYHIQSYFLLLKSNVFRSLNFSNFINSVKKEQNKIDIVINYEMGLTKFLLENKFKTDTFYKSEYKINPTSNDYINLLLQGHFIKSSLIKSEKCSDNIINTIFKNNNYPFKIINKKIYNKATRTLSPRISHDKVELINIHKDCSNYYFLVYNKSDSSQKLQLNIVNLFTNKTIIFNYENKDIYNFKNLKQQLENSNKTQTRIPLLFKIPNQILDSIDEGYIYFSDNIFFKFDYLSNSSIHKNNHLDSTFFTFIKNNKLYFTKSINKYAEYLESISVNKNKLKGALKLLNTDRRYILFAEKDDLTSDNSYSLFLYILQSNSLLKDNIFYITNEYVYNHEDNPIIKEHLVIRNSNEHYNLFMHMLVGVFTFDMSYLIPNTITHYQLSILYKFQKYILISHGYTGGYNNTAAVGALYYGKSDIIISSSSFEYNHFKYMGYNNVLLLGYPRFDKWKCSNILKDNEITFFFTFRRSLLGIELEDLLDSDYTKSIKEIVRCVHKEFPLMHINYIFHNALAKPFKEILGGILLDICDQITLVDNSDHLNFNDVLSNSKIFITDYSSSGFDMSYDPRKKVFFYIESKFLDGHYNLSSTFNKQASLANINVTYSINELIESIHNSLNKSTKSNQLFKYSDSNNSERCTNALISYIINNQNFLDNNL